MRIRRFTLALPPVIYLTSPPVYRNQSHTVALSFHGVSDARVERLSALTPAAWPKRTFNATVIWRLRPISNSAHAPAVTDIPNQEGLLSRPSNHQWQVELGKHRPPDRRPRGSTPVLGAALDSGGAVVATPSVFPVSPKRCAAWRAASRPAYATLAMGSREHSCPRAGPESVLWRRGRKTRVWHINPALPSRRELPLGESKRGLFTEQRLPDRAHDAVRCSADSAGKSLESHA